MGINWYNLLQGSTVVYIIDYYQGSNIRPTRSWVLINISTFRFVLNSLNWPARRARILSRLISIPSMDIVHKTRRASSAFCFKKACRASQSVGDADELQWFSGSGTSHSAVWSKELINWDALANGTQFRGQIDGCICMVNGMARNLSRGMMDCVQRKGIYIQATNNVAVKMRPELEQSSHQDPWMAWDCIDVSSNTAWVTGQCELRSGGCGCGRSRGQKGDVSNMAKKNI